MTPAGTAHYVYDLADHLVAELTDSGTTPREYIWLDDIPLAVVAYVDTPSPNLYYVRADHLNRPLKMTDGTEGRSVGCGLQSVRRPSTRSPAQHLTICASRPILPHDLLGFVDGPSGRRVRAPEELKT